MMSRKCLWFFAVLVVGAVVCSMGCAKRVYYANAFGEYSVSDADRQYSELFQMKPCQYREFLTFKDGWWMADVVKMKEMGITVPELCERYCRMTNIKVPFPVLIDYRILRDKV